MNDCFGDLPVVRFRVRPGMARLCLAGVPAPKAGVQSCREPCLPGPASSPGAQPGPRANNRSSTRVTRDL